MLQLPYLKDALYKLPDKQQKPMVDRKKIEKEIKAYDYEKLSFTEEARKIRRIREQKSQITIKWHE